MVDGKTKREALLDPFGPEVGPPTEQEKLFVERSVTGFLSPLDAARAAGYDDPAKAVATIYCRPEVMKLWVARLMTETVPWRALLSKSKAVLFSSLSSEDPKIRLEAAKTLTSALKGVAGSMTDAAQEEDTAADRAQLIKDVLEGSREEQKEVTH